MKVFFRLVSFLFFSLTSINVFSQVIWFENFESYTEGTGYQSSVTDDLIESVSRWNIDVSNLDLSVSNSHFKVTNVSSNKLFEAQKVNQEVIWASELIEISNYNDVVAEVLVSEVGAHEFSDYIKIYYKLDDHPETLFTTNGENFGDFEPLTAIQSGINGTSLQIIIKAKNNSISEKYRFDDVIVAQKSLMISEIGYPIDDGRFIEIRNVSESLIDFGEMTYFLSKKNASENNNWQELQLEGTLCAGSIRTYSDNNLGYYNSYGFDSDFEHEIVGGEGNDCFVIYVGGNHNTGSIVDIYGVLNPDGYEVSWNYANKKVVRKPEKQYGVDFWEISDWLITNASIDNVTPGALEDEFRFYNSVWHPNDIESNISTGSDHIVVQSGVLSISSPVSCSMLKVFSDATVILESGKGITVNGDVIVDGVLNIKSNLNASSSIIFSGQSVGDVQYDLYLTGGDANPWHLISSPVKSQNIHDFILNENNSLQVSEINNYGLAQYVPLTDAWIYFHNGSGSLPNIEFTTEDYFLSSKGYSVLRSSSGEVSFIGTLNETDQVINLSPAKWNLIGNPYLSFVDVNTLITSNTSVLNDAYNAIYLWDALSSEYKVLNYINGPSYLSPGQGFFVNAHHNGGDFLFNESMQSHQSEDWFERSSNISSLKLKAEFTSFKKSTTEIIFVDGLTMELDPGYDAGRVTFGDDDFYIFTSLLEGSDSLELSLQCLPGIHEVELEYIPLGVSVVKSTEVTFELEKSAFVDEKKVYIIDSMTGEKVCLDVDVTSYTTYINADEPRLGRFSIFISNIDKQLDAVTDANVKIFHDYQANSLKISGQIYEHTLLDIFDVLGKCVYSRVVKNGRNDIDLTELNQGVYIVKLRTNHNELIKMIII
tara:strand:+ start:9 stop:2645 length:2637 start_codon:yes stop_codon:yes gene_type:complete